MGYVRFGITSAVGAIWLTGIGARAGDHLLTSDARCIAGDQSAGMKMPRRVGRYAWGRTFPPGHRVTLVAHDSTSRGRRRTESAGQFVREPNVPTEVRLDLSLLLIQNVASHRSAAGASRNHRAVVGWPSMRHP